MAKQFKMVTILAILASTLHTETEPTIIGYAEKSSEIDELVDEYKAIYGDDISFTSRETPHIVFVALRNEAFRNLFGALYAPIDNLCVSLKSLKR